jgi:hypothetical protein
MPQIEAIADTEGTEEEDTHTTPFYCELPPVPEAEFEDDVAPARVSAILSNQDKWVNGTVLHYHFFDQDGDGEYVYFRNGTREWRAWAGADDQREVVRAAFRQWKELGIGLDFVEVDDRGEAEIRIGFMQGNGSWSYLGTYALRIGASERTMNFGWRLSGARGRDTALHEIGHALGLPHEHQNPYAGIAWDEEAVYMALGGPPNNWPRAKTHHNILRKISPDEVQGSNWDPDSVMHYPFERGLIREPAQYATGLFPAGNLSDRDRAWVQVFYPPLRADEMKELRVGRSEPLPSASGEQADFRFTPPSTRRYRFSTFGESDTVMVLFEKTKGELRYRAGDDDSGHARNARFAVRLRKGREYVLRARVKYAGDDTPFVMVW